MGSSESRKHEQENKMVGNFLSNFSHAFYFNSCLPHYLWGRGEGGGGDWDGEEDVHKLQFLFL